MITWRIGKGVVTLLCDLIFRVYERLFYYIYYIGAAFLFFLAIFSHSVLYAVPMLVNLVLIFHTNFILDEIAKIEEADKLFAKQLLEPIFKLFTRSVRLNTRLNNPIR